MSLELLKPVSENLLNELDENHLQGSLFNKIKFHRDQSVFLTLIHQIFA